MKKFITGLAASIITLISINTVFAGIDEYYPEPVVFVHGGSGSASQFESQAQRFMINGYPLSYLAAYEHPTGSGAPSPSDQIDGLDEVIDNVLARTGEARVNLIAHSRGAGVCTYYLESSPERAGKVAHYIAVDSQTGLRVIEDLGLTRTPGNVDMLALWGEGDQTRSVVGALNVYIPSQAHIESAVSAASFVEFFKFFNGFEPKTSNIVPESGQFITIQGRAVYFPENAGAIGELNIYEVKAGTGFRISDEPVASEIIEGDGGWGPFQVKKNMTYEFAFEHSNGEKHYFYREPFIRSDYFVRLNTSRPGSGLGLLLTRSPNHVDLLISRDKEIWGDQEKDNDVLFVDGINVATREAAARTKRLSGLFLLDWGYWPGSFLPESYYGAAILGESDLTAPIPIFHAQGFLSGLDYYMPAASPPDRTIKCRLTPRGRIKKTQSINIPNWASDEVRVTVVFRDFVH